MTGILAIDTSTDACSVAVAIDGQITERYEYAPRQHNQLLFGMLRALLPDGDIRNHGIDAIAYGCGPGSFTGLRIAASAVQGLAYTNDLPVVAVSTLAVIAQAALRHGVAAPDATLLCSLDARINEVYSAVYEFNAGLAVLVEGPQVCAPGDLDYAYSGPLHGVGSGLRFIDSFPAQFAARILSHDSELLPAAQDLVPLAIEMLQRGETQTPRQVQPIYVRDEISWKKISEQGKRK
jgi:tRNA threonylcarbamoyladenosine biosynthesis protein TsaB